MSIHAQDNVCIKIGVTAHRDLSCADTDSIRSQVNALFSSLRQRFPGLPLVLMNPLAEGGDMLVASVAIEMGVSLEIPVPMPLREYEQDFESPQALADFRRYCSLGHVMELPLAAGNDLESIRQQGAARDLQYAQLGMYIAGHCHVVLALWDDKKTLEPGGTSSVVHFQLTDEMPGICDPHETQRLLADKESDLVYHIHCPRDAATPTRAQGKWLSNQSTYSGIEIPDKYCLAFQRMMEFRENIIDHRDAINSAGESLLADAELQQDAQLEVIDDLYRSADWLAIKYRKLVVRELRVTHALAALMGVSFIVYSEYMEFYYLLPAFLLFFFTAWALNHLAHSRQWHRKYLDNRALAEGLRVQFYWCLGNVEGIQGAAFTYDNLMQKQDVELVWIRHVMRGIRTTPDSGEQPSGNGLNLAIKHWIGDEQGNTGQLGYYRAASLTRARLLQRNERYSRITLWCGISIAVFLVFAARSLDDTAMNILLILMGLFPLLAGIREAYAFKKADKELTKQYQFMFRTFSKAREKLQSTADPVLQRAIIRALGEACLEEHSEWILIHRERPLEHAGLQV